MMLRFLIASTLLAGLALVNAAEGSRTSDEEITVLLNFKAGLINITSQPVKLADPQAALCGLPLHRDIHANAWAGFAVSAKALKEWQVQAKNYPRGAVLVKTKFADAKGGTILLHTAMFKREPGYNPEGGDWEYDLADAKGGVQARGKLTSCMECHRRYKDTNCVAPILPASAPAK